MVMMGALLELTHTMAKETALAVLKMKVKNAMLMEMIASASRSRSD
jgi:hypothetical protein